jgi:hypothetical protein
MLGGRVRYLVLPEFYLDVRQSPAQGSEHYVIAGVIAEEDKATGPMRTKDSRRRHVIVILPLR